MVIRTSKPPKIRDYIKLSDVKAQNTSGGTFTQGSWRTRTLNTEDFDTGNRCTLAANQITLEAGVYECRIRAVGYGVNGYQARLYNITDAAEILLGTSEDSPATAKVNTQSDIVGRFIIPAGKVLEVQSICETTLNPDGFGSPANMASEVYTIAEFWKI